MSEAKTFKMKEYFTYTTYHDKIEPTNLQGTGYDSVTSHHNENINNNGFCSNRDIEKRSCSPIRYNDTYRSNVFEGDYM
jgi:hypothetical protein